MCNCCEDTINNNGEPIGEGDNGQPPGVETTLHYTVSFNPNVDHLALTNPLYEDDYIKMKTYPESWGMTIVEVKQKIDYPSQYKNWRTVLETRNKFICDLFTEDNQNGIVLERLIKDV